MAGQGVVGGLLVGVQLGAERERLRLAGHPLVDDLEAAADLGGELVEATAQAAGQDQVTADRLVVAAQKPWRVPGGCPAPLPFVEERGWASTRGA